MKKENKFELIGIILIQLLLMICIILWSTILQLSIIQDKYLLAVIAGFVCMFGFYFYEKMIKEEIKITHYVINKKELDNQVSPDFDMNDKTIINSIYGKESLKK